jgi:hypothetical protein
MLLFSVAFLPHNSQVIFQAPGSVQIHALARCSARWGFAFTRGAPDAGDPHRALLAGPKSDAADAAQPRAGNEVAADAAAELRRVVD